MRSSPRARAGVSGSRSWRRSRTRGSTWRRATASTTTTELARRSDDPVRLVDRAHRSAACRRGHRPALRSHRHRARAARERVRRPARRRGAKGFDELLALSRTVFPYVEEHKFLCDYWFLTSWWNKIRDFGRLLAEHGFLADAEDVFQLSRLEVYSALDELLLTWATGGQPRGPSYWPPIVARRKELLERLADWTPPPAVGAVPEAVLDPALIMLWGVTTQRVHAWAQETEAARPERHPASPGVVEGVARVVEARERDRRRARGRDPRLQHHLARLGADLLEDPGRRDGHRRRHVARGDRLPRALPAVVGTGRATSQIRTDSASASTARPAA